MYKISQAITRSKRRQIIYVLGFILLIVLFSGLLFLLNIFSAASNQYVKLGGQLENLTLTERLGLANQFIKATYFKSPAEKLEELRRAEQLEAARIRLPMNQWFRVTVLSRPEYVGSLALPAAWRGRYQIQEVDDLVKVSMVNGPGSNLLFTIKVSLAEEVSKNLDQTKIFKAAIFGNNVFLAQAQSDQPKEKKALEQYHKMQNDFKEIVANFRVFKTE